MFLQHKRVSSAIPSSDGVRWEKMMVCGQSPRWSAHHLFPVSKLEGEQCALFVHRRRSIRRAHDWEDPCERSHFNHALGSRRQGGFADDVARAGLHRSHDLRPLQGLRRVIRAMTEFHGIVNIRIDRNGVPMLRLLQSHAPDMRIECLKDEGLYPTYLVPLRQIDLDHGRLVALNVADLPKPPVAEKAP